MFITSALWWKGSYNVLDVFTSQASHIYIGKIVFSWVVTRMKSPLSATFLEGLPPKKGTAG